MEIVNKAQKFIEHSSLKLEGEEDFPPFILIINDNGEEFFAGFTQMPSDPEAKNALADIIMALCVVHGAAEAAFGSTAWSAVGEGDLPPSQRPDRKEVAFVSTANSTGINAVRVAEVVRENGRVGIGLWEHFPAEEASGRFAEALHMGLKLSRKMPPATRAFLAEQMDAGLEEEILRSTVGIIAEARKSGLTMEEGKWEK